MHRDFMCLGPQLTQRLGDDEKRTVGVSQGGSRLRCESPKGKPGTAAGNRRGKHTSFQPYAKGQREHSPQFRMLLLRKGRLTYLGLKLPGATCALP